MPRGIPVLLLLSGMAGCSGPTGAPSLSGAGLAAAESVYADLRELRDRFEVTTASGRRSTPEGVPLATLAARHDALRGAAGSRLSELDSGALGADDARALAVMRHTVARALTPLGALEAGSPAAETRPDCEYDPRSIRSLDSLRGRIYACYGWAQSHVVAGTDTLDRLTVLGALGRTADAIERRRLFLALEPVWRTVNADNRPGSPYRQLISRHVAERRGEPPAARQARASGVHPDSLEGWLLAILETWRAGIADSLVEPWDWYYETGTTDRRLGRRIPLDRLGELNAAVYRALGADVDSLGVRYDLAPREGKTPVAFCTFGRRPRFRGGRWQPGEPWVFATYRDGGLDNLYELLHETGHAVHIAAVRARPAFADWPDSDPFTEALAEFVALDVYEPAWQRHWLGDSVPLQDGLRGRYGGVVLDMAWALFESRMQRDPAADPNQVWTALTRDYLRIRPHPELSWWAMRGQLVDSPGYMMNYAAGAILIAAIRAHTAAVHGPFIRGDSTWYGWVAPRLFRFGLERPSREVIEAYLGGPVTPAALLDDMRRMAAP